MKKNVYLMESKVDIESLPKITSKKITKDSKYDPKGLFSEVIFGPVNSFTCSCKRPQIIGNICEKCGTEIIDNSVRRERFGRICLEDFPVFDPLYYEFINRNIRNNIDELINFRSYFKFNEQGNLEKYQIEYYNIDFVMPTDDDIFVGIKGAMKYLYLLFDKGLLSNIVNIKKYGHIFEKREDIEKFLIKDVIVLPPDLRPYIKLNNINSVYSDPINKDYLNIINSLNTLQDKNNVISGVSDIYIYDSYSKLQESVFNIYTQIMNVFSPKKGGSKKGIFRKNMLGKRIDYSGRAVICPDATLGIDECRVSYFILLETMKYKLIHKLMIKYSTSNDLIDVSEHILKDEIDDSINKGELKYKDDIQEILDEENVYCLLNRQPTLHRHGIMGFKVLMGFDKTIKISPLVCGPYNADFDGDQIAIYFPMADESINEIKTKLLPSQNLIMEASGEVGFIPGLDVILGLHHIQKSVDEGIIEYPKDFPEELKGNCANKRLIKNAVNNIYKKYGAERTVEVLEYIKFTGFEYAKLSGTTFSISDFIIKDKFDKSIYTKDIKKSQELEEKEIDKLKTQCTFADMINSGARGSWDQVKQIIGARGFVATVEGKILPQAIKSSLADGLSPYEYFLSNYGVRKGLSDISDNTAMSGQLERQLVYAGINVLKDSSNEDCGTIHGLKINNIDEKYLTLLIGRWIKCLDDDEYIKLTEDDIPKYVNKSVIIRSPIYCIGKDGICEKCCPDVKQKYVGVLSAQVLGEKGTQMVLRVFHTSGVAGNVGVDDENTDVVSDLRKVIRVLSKPDEIIVDKESIFEYIKKLYDMYNVYGKILLLHYEIIVSAMLVDENNNAWRLSDKVTNPTALSYKKIPKLNSFLGGIASHFKQSLKDSIGKKCGDSFFTKTIIGLDL